MGRPSTTIAAMILPLLPLLAVVGNDHEAYSTGRDKGELLISVAMMQSQSNKMGGRCNHLLPI